MRKKKLKHHNYHYPGSGPGWMSVHCIKDNRLVSLCFLFIETLSGFRNKNERSVNSKTAAFADTYIVMHQLYWEVSSIPGLPPTMGGWEPGYSSASEKNEGV